MTLESTTLVGSTLAQGRYLVKRKLGEGGMAFVLLALDNNLGAEVVLKVPKPGLFADPEFAARFSREIRSTVAVAHPHVVKIRDVREQDGTPYYVMDFLAGGSLEDRFERVKDRKTPQPAESLTDWLEPVAEALDFIHQRFVHRDVKPANILFDAFGTPFVGDFGIVKAVTDSVSKKKQTVLTQAGMVIGTQPYMAPEIIEGLAYDGRADQYSLAVTVYEVLSGRLPFDGETLADIIRQHMAGKAEPLHVRVPRLPKTLSQAVARGLSRDPKERYASCAVFAKAVLAALQATPSGTEAAPRAKGGPRAVCPSCRKAFALPPNPAGKRVTCPACAASITVAKKGTDQDQETKNSSRPPADTSELERPPDRKPVAAKPKAVKKKPEVSSRRVWLYVVAALLTLGIAAVVIWAVFYSGGPRQRGYREKILGN